MMTKKKNKNYDNRIRNLILHNLIAYHTDKIDAVEYCKRFMRLDKFYKYK